MGIGTSHMNEGGWQPDPQTRGTVAGPDPQTRGTMARARSTNTNRAAGPGQHGAQGRALCALCASVSPRWSHPALSLLQVVKCHSQNLCPRAGAPAPVAHPAPAATGPQLTPAAGRTLGCSRTPAYPQVPRKEISIFLCNKKALSEAFC